LEALAQQEVFAIKRKVPVWATLDGPRTTATTTLNGNGEYRSQWVMQADDPIPNDTGALGVARGP
jgi:hypothetical protein